MGKKAKGPKGSKGSKDVQATVKDRKGQATTAKSPSVPGPEILPLTAKANVRAQEALRCATRFPAQRTPRGSRPRIVGIRCRS